VIWASLSIPDTALLRSAAPTLASNYGRSPQIVPPVPKTATQGGDASLAAPPNPLHTNLTAITLIATTRFAGTEMWVSMNLSYLCDFAIDHDAPDASVCAQRFARRAIVPTTRPARNRQRHVPKSG
jgi:hypothetical protein